MKNQAFQPKNPRKSAKNDQSGNVLILIFIAIALFGSLSWVMMRGNRANTGLMTGEQAKLRATEMVNYANQMRDGIKKIMIGGVPLENISLQMQNLMDDSGVPQPNYLENTNCTTQSCRLFSPQGGGVKEQQFYEDAVRDSWWGPTWIKPGGAQLVLIDVKDVGTNKPEIMLQIPQVKKEICDVVNNMMNLPLDLQAPSDAGKTFYQANPGDLNATDATNAGYASPTLAGKRAYCDTGSRTINMVVLAR
jgi:hypothetical protein